jgi:hypothetical protein
MKTWWTLLLSWNNVLLSRPVGLDSWYKSRLRFLDMLRPTFETCQDFLNMSRQAFSNVKIESPDQDILKIETCRDFRALTLSRFVEMSFFKLSRKSRQSRCHFSNCQESLNRQDLTFRNVSIETQSRQIKTPHPYFYVKLQ